MNNGYLLERNRSLLEISDKVAIRQINREREVKRERGKERVGKRERERGRERDIEREREKRG